MFTRFDFDLSQALDGEFTSDVFDNNDGLGPSVHVDMETLGVATLALRTMGIIPLRGDGAQAVDWNSRFVTVLAEFGGVQPTWDMPEPK